MSELFQGTFEAAKNGGYLRSSQSNYRSQPSDPVVSHEVCRTVGLRGGEAVEAQIQRNGQRKAPAIRSRDDIVTVNGVSSEDYLHLKPFDELTAINPDRAVRFEIPNGPLSMRVIDLMTPIGLGQRGLIVAAPRTGKTVLLQQMAAGIAANHPDVYMMVLLIDERPEEVTEMRRTVHGEVVASSNDCDIASHVRIARLMTQKAKRFVEAGRDVLILLDSLTRLGRAFNSNIRGGGRVMSGGLDIRALAEPKSIFGAARNVEHGGSLTIIASCLVDTGSRMDEVIFNEFKGTGNMEIMLTRELSDRRIWPAIDLQRSGTRREELLLSPAQLQVSHAVRRSMLDRGAERAMTALLAEMGKYPSNAAWIAEASRGLVGRP